MPNASKSYREELLEARANVQRQLDILRLSGRRTVCEPKPIPLVLKLTATLKEIDDSLAELGDDDAPRP